MESAAGSGSRVRVPVHAQARASGVRKGDRISAGTVSGAWKWTEQRVATIDGTQLESPARWQSYPFR